MPSIAENGQFVRVLVLFVQFADDMWEPLWTEWEKGDPPTTWMDESTIDQTITQNSTNGNITHYFTGMSMGHYKIIGEFQHRITSQTRDEYIDAGMIRKDINEEVLQDLNNTGFDFTPYDVWTKNDPYDFEWGPDGEVDMIWMIYRNIGEDKPNPGYTAWQLGFGHREFRNGQWVYFKWSGEASLGGGGILPVNGGKTIDLGSFYDLISGITIMYGYNGLGAVKAVTIHEFGHHLLGGTSEHIKPGVWGIMRGYASRSQVVNSYERQKLGWINLIQYNYNPLIPFPLYDYVTTGDALKIAIPGTNDYYLLENHQRLSTLDNFDRTSDGKGVYVLYQDGTRNLDLEFYNAEGRAFWHFDHYAMHPAGVEVPVFRKGSHNRIDGNFDTESIPYIDPVTGLPVSSVIEAYINSDGDDVFEPLFRGDGKDMMKPDYTEVFGPWSNPLLQSVAFQVVLDNNQIEINQKVESGTQLSLPPSKSYLGWDPREDFPYEYGWIYLAWGLDFWDEQPIEPDYEWSELQRKIGSGPWVTLYSGPNRVWSDGSITYDPNGSTPVYFRVRIRDSQGLWSVWSDLFSTKMIPGNPVFEKSGSGKTSEIMLLLYSLEQNYPNPFNPTTTISYSIEKDGLVTLKVFDILGKEVAALVNERMTAGYHSVDFNADNLPSGIYVYKLTSGNFTESKKLILLK